MKAATFMNMRFNQSIDCNNTKRNYCCRLMGDIPEEFLSPAIVTQFSKRIWICAYRKFNHMTAFDFDRKIILLSGDIHEHRMLLLLLLLRHDT